MVSTSIRKQLSNQQSNLDRVSSQLGSILGRFWGQDEPQLAPNRSKNRSQKRYKKRSHFRSPQDRFLIDFGLQLGGSRGVRWGSVGRLFGLLKLPWSQDEPKSPPRSPRVPPRGVLEPPRPLQEASWERFYTILTPKDPPKTSATTPPTAFPKNLQDPSKSHQDNPQETLRTTPRPRF